MKWTAVKWFCVLLDAHGRRALRVARFPGEPRASTRIANPDDAAARVQPCPVDHHRHRAEQDFSSPLSAAGVTNGGVVELPAFGVANLSVQDPDDITLE